MKSLVFLFAIGLLTLYVCCETQLEEASLDEFSESSVLGVGILDNVEPNVLEDAEIEFRRIKHHFHPKRQARKAEKKMRKLAGLTGKDHYVLDEANPEFDIRFLKYIGKHLANLRNNNHYSLEADNEWSFFRSRKPIKPAKGKKLASLTSTNHYVQSAEEANTLNAEADPAWSLYPYLKSLLPKGLLIGDLGSTNHYALESAAPEFSLYPYLKSLLPGRLWADLRGTNHYVLESAAPEWSFYSLFSPKRSIASLRGTNHYVEDADSEWKFKFRPDHKFFHPKKHHTLEEDTQMIEISSISKIVRNLVTKAVGAPNFKQLIGDFGNFNFNALSNDNADQALVLRDLEL